MDLPLPLCSPLASLHSTSTPSPPRGPVSESVLLSLFIHSSFTLHSLFIHSSFTLLSLFFVCFCLACFSVVVLSPPFVTLCFPSRSPSLSLSLSAHLELVIHPLIPLAYYNRFKVPCRFKHEHVVSPRLNSNVVCCISFASHVVFMFLF